MLGLCPHLSAAVAAAGAGIALWPPAAGAAGCGQVSRDYRFADGGSGVELEGESDCRRSLAVAGVSIEVPATERPRITAVLVSRRGIRTTEGAQVGDDASRLAAVYPGALK